MSKPIRFRMHDSVQAGTFADRTIERLTPGDPANIGREVERLTARLLNVHQARCERTDADEIGLRARLGAAWSTVAKTLDALGRVVREAEEIDRKAAAPAISGAKKMKDGNAASMANIVGDMNRTNSEFWNR